MEGAGGGGSAPGAPLLAPEPTDSTGREKNPRECTAQAQVDPITLDPLRRLPYAPFGLRAPSGFMHYFDGRVLGSYLVSSGTFLNPLTGLPVARADCERLDAYLRALPRRLGKPCVTQVFDAKLRELQAAEAREVRDLQVRRPVARRPPWGTTHNGLCPMPRPARPRAAPRLAALTGRAATRAGGGGLHPRGHLLQP